MYIKFLPHVYIYTDRYVYAPYVHGEETESGGIGEYMICVGTDIGLAVMTAIASCKLGLALAILDCCHSMGIAPVTLSFLAAWDGCCWMHTHADVFAKT